MNRKKSKLKKETKPGGRSKPEPAESSNDKQLLIKSDPVDPPYERPCY